MSQYFQMHPVTPQQRLVRQTVEIIVSGGVIAYPTDSTYALACRMGEKAAVERIRHIRNLGERHNFTLACRDLSDIGTYAKVENSVYRLLKAFTPGPYTFILRATHEVPRRLQHPKRKTVGIRVPGNPISQAILRELGEPLMTTSLIMPFEELPLTDPHEIRQRLEKSIDLVVDGGAGGHEPSTVVDLVDNVARIIRRGAGDASVFESAQA